jgi:xylan 1,4-beta-xylosidase
MRAGTAALLLLTLVLLASASSARADYVNPVLPGDYPDPSIVRIGPDYYATATSDSWAPVFPILHSRDLVSWDQIGSVFPIAPTWATGHRFWAPEISWIGGRVVVLYAALKSSGRFCIGAATATVPQGPWTDQGPVLCRDGGSIDPTSVVREDGTTWVVWKAQGLGGGLFAQQIDPVTLRPAGGSIPLIAPDRGFERGVTEGPSVFKQGDYWYLMYSGGGCCKVPCSYVEGVARSTDLLGPYVKRDQPVLVGDDQWHCPGHGTVVRLADGQLDFLHHAYAADDVLDRRRQGLLTPLWIDGEGWPVLGAGSPPTAATSPLGGVQQRGPATFSDTFDTPEPTPGWQSVIRSAMAQVVTGDGHLALGCGGSGALITRQVAVDRFSVAVTIAAPTGGAMPSLVVREPDGTQRGLEVRPGSVRAIKRRAGVVALGPPVAIPRDHGARVVVTVAPGGNVATYVETAAGLRRVTEGPAALGVGPTRIGLACRGAGTALFANLRLAGDGTAPVGVPVGD